MPRSRRFYLLVALIFSALLLPLLGADGCITITDVVPPYGQAQPVEPYQVKIFGQGFIDHWQKNYGNDVCVKLKDLILCKSGVAHPLCAGGDSRITDIFDKQIWLQVAPPTSETEGVGDVVVGVLGTDCVDTRNGNEAGETWPDRFTFYDAGSIENRYQLLGQNMPHVNRWGDNAELRDIEGNGFDINGDGFEDMMSAEGELRLYLSVGDEEPDGVPNYAFVTVPGAQGVRDVDLFPLDRDRDGHDEQYIFVSTTYANICFEFLEWGWDWETHGCTAKFENGQSDACLKDVTGELFQGDAAIVSEQTMAADIGWIEVGGIGTLAIALANGGFESRQGPINALNRDVVNRFYYFDENSTPGTFKHPDSPYPADVNNSVDIEFVDLDDDPFDDAVFIANFDSSNPPSGRAAEQNRLYDIQSIETGFPDLYPSGLDVTYTQGVDAADLNGDGCEDLVMIDHTTSPGQEDELKVILPVKNGQDCEIEAPPALYTHDLSGLTTSPFYDVGIGTLDGDHTLDLIVAGEKSGILYNLGNVEQAWQGFGSPEHVNDPPMVYSSISVAVSELNGYPAFVLGDIAEQNRLFVRLEDAPVDMTISAGFFPPDGSLTYAGAMGDLDNDGDADMVVVTGEDGSDAKSFLFKQSGDDSSGRFFNDLDAWSPTERITNRSVVLTEINGDDCIDIFVGSEQTANEIYLNGVGQDPCGVFTKQDLPEATYQKINSRFASSFVSAIRLDAGFEGLLAIANRVGPSYVCEIPLGGGIPTDNDCYELQNPTGGASPAEAVFADLDNDNDSDLVIARCQANCRIDVYRNPGDDSFRTVTPSVAGNNLIGVESIVVANFDHGTGTSDRLPDIFVASGVPTSVGQALENALLRNEGNFTFSTVPPEEVFPGMTREVSGATVDAVAADLDGDNDLDIIMANRDSFVTSKLDTETAPIDRILINFEGENGRPVFSDLTVPFFGVGKHSIVNAPGPLVSLHRHWGVAVYPETPPGGDPVQPDYILLVADGQTNVLRKRPAQ